MGPDSKSSRQARPSSIAARNCSRRVAGRADVASATRRPWIDANGWRFARNPAGEFYYDLPQGKAAMAIAEAFAYNADAILKIDPADLAEAGAMFAFIKNLTGENYRRSPTSASSTTNRRRRAKL